MWHGRNRKGRTEATQGGHGMEVGKRIREHRAGAGMSQDDLAARVYVSRQTISSWENDKTYPDVQSLILLSEIFGVTVDTLIKGDVETMTETIDTDVRTMKRLSYVMLGFLLLTILTMVWISVQFFAWDWPVQQLVPSFVLALVLWGIAMFAACWVERIKKQHDLMTYHEILSFWNGEKVARDTEKRQRESLIPRSLKIVRAVGKMLIAMAVDAFLGYGGAMLAHALLG